MSMVLVPAPARMIRASELLALDLLWSEACECTTNFLTLLQQLGSHLSLCQGQKLLRVPVK